MEENMSTAPAQKSGRNMLIIGAVLLLVVAAVAAAMAMRGNQAATVNETAQQMQAIEDTPAGTTADDALIDGTDEATSEMVAEEGTTMTVVGGNFSFEPNEIRVKQGETVKIIFQNEEGMHDFVIDEFNVKTEQIGAGETTEVTFVADQAGEFEFYCNVGQHRQMGMVGTLIVEE